MSDNKPLHCIHGFKTVCPYCEIDRLNESIDALLDKETRMVFKSDYDADITRLKGEHKALLGIVDAQARQLVDALGARLLVIDEYEKQLAEARAEVERHKEEYQSACTTVAEMHRAAVGEITGPKRGVVEDVYDAVEQARQEAARQIVELFIDYMSWSSDSTAYELFIKEVSEAYGLEG